jgi:hypothetical protein
VAVPIFVPLACQYCSLPHSRHGSVGSRVTVSTIVVEHDLWLYPGLIALDSHISLGDSPQVIQSHSRNLLRLDMDERTWTIGLNEVTIRWFDSHHCAAEAHSSSLKGNL